MGKQKGYIVLEIGFEYNDEYYHANSYGNTYEAPKKVYTDKAAAEEALKVATFERLRGEDLGRYNGDGIEGICKKGMKYEMEKLFKEEFDQDINDYEFEVPQEATDEQLEKLLECMDFEFFELVEVELE